jgi:hypothetical protein
MNINGDSSQLYPPEHTENKNAGVTEQAEFEKISSDAFLLAGGSFVLVFVLLLQTVLDFLLRLLSYPTALLGQETAPSEGL